MDRSHRAYITDDGSEMHSRAWITVFYRHVLFREFCYHCKYTIVERRSDFTISDYRGINRNVPQFDNNKDCSLVLVHSDTGKNVFEEVKQYINYEETKLETSIQSQMKKHLESLGV